MSTYLVLVEVVLVVVSEALIREIAYRITEGYNTLAPFALYAITRQFLGKAHVIPGLVHAEIVVGFNPVEIMIGLNP
uniref:Uncharacterized protein n=1 Tax=Parascaris equorum TaxID=6256 RepID=A0A914RMI4_PAREQ